MNLAYFDGPLFLARWHFKFLFLNRRMDKHSVSLLLMLDYFYSLAPLNVTPEKGTFSGQSSYRRSKISTGVAFLLLSGASETIHCDIWQDALGATCVLSLRIQRSGRF